MRRLRIVADRNLPGVEPLFAPWGEVCLVEGRGLCAEQLREADVLLVRSVTRVDAGLLAGTPVRFVGSGTAGLDHVDQAWLRSRGISFAAAPGANANAVVEYVLAAVAAVDAFAERLLAGSRVGIIGYGQVGSRLATRLTALGVASCQYDPWLPAGSLPCPASLEDVLSCDVVTLHCALTRQAPYPSRHLLDAEALAGLGGRQLLINASRGPVVDNQALLARLRKADAPRCVLDVWEREPEVPADLLEQVALGTPHIAGYSLEAKWAATSQLASALADFLGSAPPESNGLPAPAVIELPAGLTGAALWRHLLFCRYDPREDDRALRALAERGGPEAMASGFDALRRSYRERRELAGSPLRCSDPAQVALARAMGCRVEEG